MSPLWAKDADLTVTHSAMPVEARNYGNPNIVALHGRPEYAFELERRGVSTVLGLLKNMAEDPQCILGITFWSEHIPFWETLYPELKIEYIPAMVDLNAFTPEGKIYDFTGKGGKSGTPNIVIADVWREDVTPFQCYYAATEFVKKNGGKIHIFGLSEPNKNSCYADIFNPASKQGLVGSVNGIVPYIDRIYRAADFVVTPHSIATRVVRESLACGCPIVAGTGNKCTPYKADPYDTISFVEMMEKCWHDVQEAGKESMSNVCRNFAEMKFNLKQAGEKAKMIYEDVLASSPKYIAPKMKGEIFTFIPYATNGDLGSAYNGHIQAVDDDDWACFIDHDVMWTTPDWNKQLRQIIAEHPDYGCFSVMTNRIGNPEQKVSDLEDTHDILYHRRIGKELWEKNGTKVVDVSKTHAISGVVILIYRKAWEEVGGFPTGWMGIDNEFHNRLVKAGVKVGLCKGIYVYHYYRGNGELIKNKKQGRQGIVPSLAPSKAVAPQLKE